MIARTSLNQHRPDHLIHMITFEILRNMLLANAALILHQSRRDHKPLMKTVSMHPFHRSCTFAWCYPAGMISFRVTVSAYLKRTRTLYELPKKHHLPSCFNLKRSTIIEQNPISMQEINRVLS